MGRPALNAAGELNEAAWQSRVVGLARLYGWRPFHAPDGGHAPARPGARRVAGGQLPEGRGFPDLVLLRPPRLVVAELKTRTGRMGPGQEEWLDLFRELGDAIAALEAPLSQRVTGRRIEAPHPPAVEAYVWRPADWEDVQRVLGRGQERRVELDPLT